MTAEINVSVVAVMVADVVAVTTSLHIATTLNLTLQVSRWPLRTKPQNRAPLFLRFLLLFSRY